MLDRPTSFWTVRTSSPDDLEWPFDKITSFRVGNLRAYVAGLCESIADLTARIIKALDSLVSISLPRYHDIVIVERSVEI